MTTTPESSSPTAPATVPAVPAPVADSVLDDLRDRLRRTRWADDIAADDDRLGVRRSTLEPLVRAWAEEYDWRPHEERLRALPWVVTGDRSGRVRAVHQRADAGATAVVLLHGWPDSFLRFDRVRPLLADFDVVVPCVPGFPWSADPMRGRSSADIVDLLDRSMSELGYERFVVSGGDIGSSIAEAWASRHPERVSALHLTDIPYRHIFTVDPTELTPEEQTYLEAGKTWQLAEGGYAIEQSSKPNTLAVGLGDSPAGLAAWIVEKLTSWSDSGGQVESVFPRDELLTWLTLYWVSGAIGTSFSPYASQDDPTTGPVTAPTAVTIFPKDLVPAPRAFGERFFDIVSWDERPSGGHFGAWEDPEAFVAGVRAAVDAAS